METSSIETQINLLHDFNLVYSEYKTYEEILDELNEISATPIVWTTTVCKKDSSSLDEIYETSISIENVIAKFNATSHDECQSQFNAVSKVFVHLKNLSKLIEDFKSGKYLSS